MHSTDGVTPGICFYHNGDFSGEVEIAIEPEEVILRIPFVDVKRLVAEYIRTVRTERLETASDEELLGL